MYPPAVAVFVAVGNWQMRRFVLLSPVFAGGQRTKRNWEAIMPRIYRSAALCLSAIISLAILSSGNVSAATKKKLTYEEAWTYCKNRMDKEKVPNTTGMGNERFLRGGACMKHFGYNL
jgi:hypothetical protein